MSGGRRVHASATVTIARRRGGAGRRRGRRRARASRRSRSSGLPDLAVLEARERVRSAVRASAASTSPTRACVVNLAPGPLRKHGTGFDLPIALALLAATRAAARRDRRGHARSSASSRSTERCVRCPGMLAHALAARRRPACSSGPDADGVSHERSPGLRCRSMRPPSRCACAPRPRHRRPGRPRLRSAHRVADLAEVAGQELAKRALVIAAAGGHNVLMVGPPGSGKTMLARRLPGILPPLDRGGAARDRARALGGRARRAAGARRGAPVPRAAPLGSIAGLVGGGSPPRPGEVSLAHNGVLFLDEMPEFGPAALQALRQPLEDGSGRARPRRGARPVPGALRARRRRRTRARAASSATRSARARAPPAVVSATTAGSAGRSWTASTCACGSTASTRSASSAARTARRRSSRAARARVDARGRALRRRERLRRRALSGAALLAACRLAPSQPRRRRGACPHASPLRPRRHAAAAGRAHDRRPRGRRRVSTETTSIEAVGLPDGDGGDALARHDRERFELAVGDPRYPEQLRADARAARSALRHRRPGAPRARARGRRRAEGDAVRARGCARCSPAGRPRRATSSSPAAAIGCDQAAHRAALDAGGAHRRGARVRRRRRLPARAPRRCSPRSAATGGASSRSCRGARRPRGGRSARATASSPGSRRPSSSSRRRCRAARSRPPTTRWTRAGTCSSCRARSSRPSAAAANRLLRQGATPITDVSELARARAVGLLGRTRRARTGRDRRSTSDDPLAAGADGRPHAARRPRARPRPRHRRRRAQASARLEASGSRRPLPRRALRAAGASEREAASAGTLQSTHDRRRASDRKAAA